LQEVGNRAFYLSVFTGEFNCPNVHTIDQYAFRSSNFTGEFNCPNVQEVGYNAFRNSQFTGDFNCPVCTTIGENSFLNSAFTKITIGANATLGTNCIGAHSEEFINDYEANNKLAGTYVWDADTNHWVYQS